MKNGLAPKTCMDCKKKLPDDGICRDRCISRVPRVYKKKEGVDRWKK
jgi:hypothetical protein